MDMRSLEQINEEYYGIEYEDDFIVDEDIEHPFDADKIRIDQQMLSLKYIYDLMEEGEIDTSPSFQRNKVWTERKRKSLLIESLMLRIPIPTFYFYENEESKFIVIDGQQRLTTIRDFINNKFKLSGLEYLQESCGGKFFKELDLKYQQRINRTQFAVNILDSRSPLNVLFDIFRRVNTGGVSLKPQEIRNAIAKENIRNFLKKLSTSDMFIRATRSRVKDDRMDAQELVLRYIAFNKIYKEQDGDVDYNKGDLTSYLDYVMFELNNLSISELNEIECEFYKSMDRVYKLLGKYCFRKVYIDDNGNIKSGKVDIINKSLFTSWSVVLSDYKYSDLDYKNISKETTYKLAEYLTNDYEYNTILTQGTNSRKSININFNMTQKILNEVINSD